MTRHGIVEPSAAGASPPATDPRASTVNIAADSFTTSLVPYRLDRAQAQRSGLSVSIPTYQSGGCAIGGIGRRSKSP